MYKALERGDKCHLTSTMCQTVENIAFMTEALEAARGVDAGMVTRPVKRTLVNVWEEGKYRETGMNSHYSLTQLLTTHLRFYNEKKTLFMAAWISNKLQCDLANNKTFFKIENHFVWNETLVDSLSRSTFPLLITGALAHFSIPELPVDHFPISLFRPLKKIQFNERSL